MVKVYFKLQSGILGKGVYVSRQKDKISKSVDKIGTSLSVIDSYVKKHSRFLTIEPVILNKFKSKSTNNNIVSKLKTKLRLNRTKSLKIQKLETELKKLVVIAPFVSEGNISLVQIGRFSANQKKQWEKNKSRRFDVIDQLALLKLTSKEKFKLTLSKKLKY